MDVIADISWSSLDPHRPVPSAAVRAWVAAILSCLLALAALFLLARRLAGGLTAPLPALPLVGVALIAIAAALAVHLLCRASRADSVVPANVLLVLTIFALPVIAIALSLPGNSPASVSLLWATVGIAEIGLWQLRRSRPISNSLRNKSRAASVGSSAPSIALDNHLGPTPTSPESTTATQRLVYHCATDGRLRVEGWVRADFIADQRIAIVHVAFCPAFNHAPTIDAELVDGPSGELRPTLALPWGVRWELKLDTPATELTTAAFEFLAHEPPDPN